MSPFSTPVLAGAALLTSPAWWRALEGTGSLSVATTRFLVAALACWLAFEMLAALVGPAPVAVHAVDESGSGAAPGSVPGPGTASGAMSGAGASSAPGETGDGPAVS